MVGNLREVYGVQSMWRLQTKCTYLHAWIPNVSWPTEYHILLKIFLRVLWVFVLKLPNWNSEPHTGSQVKWARWICFKIPLFQCQAELQMILLMCIKENFWYENHRDIHNQNFRFNQCFPSRGNIDWIWIFNVLRERSQEQEQLNHIKQDMHYIMNIFSLQYTHIY